MIIMRINPQGEQVRYLGTCLLMQNQPLTPSVARASPLQECETLFLDRHAVMWLCILRLALYSQLRTIIRFRLFMVHRQARRRKDEDKEE